MKDIAAEIGVSVATVSRALRNDPRQSAAMRAQVQAVATRLGYRPDPFISAWVSSRWGRTERELGTIACIHVQSGGIWSQLLAGAEARAQVHGYRLEEFKIKEAGVTMTRLSRILVSRGIRGVCIAPLPEKGMLTLDWAEFACATIGHSLENPHLHRASPDQFQGMGLVLQKVRAEGYRNIGLCLDRRVNIKVNGNWQARALLFAEQNPDCRLNVLLVDKAKAKEEFVRWFKRCRPDVLVGSEDFVVRWAKELGLAVPIRLLAWSAESGCAGVDERRGEVGAAAIDLIVEQLRRNERGVPEVPKLVLIEGVWREAAGRTAIAAR